MAASSNITSRSTPLNNMFWRLQSVCTPICSPARLGGHWLLTVVGGIEDAIDLESVGCRIALRDSYDKVEFDA